jgi:diguanylate cyclase (GGDEF)-like protein
MPAAHVRTELASDIEVVIADGREVGPQLAEGATPPVIIRLSSDSSAGDVARETFLHDPASFIRVARSAAESRRSHELVHEEIAFGRHVRELMAAGDLPSVFQKVARSAADLCDAAWTTILLHDPVIERFAVVYSTDPEQPEGGDFLPGVPADLLQEAINAPSGVSIRPAQGRRGGFCVVPLRIGDDLIGVVTMARSRGENFDEELVRAAGLYIRGIAPLLITLHQLSRSRDLALRDDLTKAFNRRFFESYLEEEIERARRYSSLVSVIFLDLDDLKLVNNKFGHLSGSRMLQEVARRILGAVRAIDKVVRFGGDEFCIILPQTDPDQARAVAMRVRKAMSERDFVLDPGIEIPMTASFGIATYPVHARSKEDLIRAADTAMYRVKSTSKNAIEEALRIERPRAVDAEPAH